VAAEFHNYRQRAIEEHGEECGVCADSDGVQVHHIDGDRGNNDIENLIPLCRDCHSTVHSVAAHSSGTQLQQLAAELKPREQREGEPGEYTRISVSIPNDMAERLHEDLSYGDNRSEIVREALREYFGMEAEP